MANEQIDDELIIPHWFYKEYCSKCDEYKNFKNRYINDELFMRDFCGMGWTCYGCSSGSNFRRTLIRVCEDNWKHDKIKSICRYCDRVRYDNYPNPINYCGDNDEICKKIYHKKYCSKKNVLNVLQSFIILIL